MAIAIIVAISLSWVLNNGGSSAWVGGDYLALF